MHAQEIEFTEQNFDKQIAEGVSLVDFWAAWCGPCKMQAPIVEKVAAKLGDQANIGKCNVDENPGLAARFGIQSIPTILFFKDGEPVGQVVGLQSEEALANKVNELL
ncbi:MAG: thioredoxin [Candidatus Sumerlaeia bacterium]